METLTMDRIADCLRLFKDLTISPELAIAEAITRCGRDELDRLKVSAVNYIAEALCNGTVGPRVCLQFESLLRRDWIDPDGAAQMLEEFGDSVTGGDPFGGDIDEKGATKDNQGLSPGSPLVGDIFTRVEREDEKADERKRLLIGLADLFNSLIKLYPQIVVSRDLAALAKRFAHRYPRFDLLTSGVVIGRDHLSSKEKGGICLDLPEHGVPTSASPYNSLYALEEYSIPHTCYCVEYCDNLMIGGETLMEWAIDKKLCVDRDIPFSFEGKGENLVMSSSGRKEGKARAVSLTGQGLPGGNAALAVGVDDQEVEMRCGVAFLRRDDDNVWQLEHGWIPSFLQLSRLAFVDNLLCFGCETVSEGSCIAVNAEGNRRISTYAARRVVDVTALDIFSFLSVGEEVCIWDVRLNSGAAQRLHLSNESFLTSCCSFGGEMSRLVSRGLETVCPGYISPYLCMGAEEGNLYVFDQRNLTKGPIDDLTVELDGSILKCVPLRTSYLGMKGGNENDDIIHPLGGMMRDFSQMLCPVAVCDTVGLHTVNFPLAPKYDKKIVHSAHVDIVGVESFSCPPSPSPPHPSSSPLSSSPPSCPGKESHLSPQEKTSFSHIQDAVVLDGENKDSKTFYDITVYGNALFAGSIDGITHFRSEWTDISS